MPHAPDTAPTGRRVRPGGGYRRLLTFRLATVLYDATVQFCRRFVARDSRTTDQMTQSARSGRQNIAEGSKSASASSQTELRLVNTARSSLEELLLDYEDVLRQNGLPQWDKDDPLARRVRAVRLPPEPPADTGQADYALYASWLDSPDRAVAANAAICLLHSANYLLDRQLETLERQFIQGGGYSEQLAAARLAHRSTDAAGGGGRSPSCPRCSAPMVLRTAHRGRNKGNQFWGCSKYPECTEIRDLDPPRSQQT